MRFTVLINQKAIIDADLGLDLIDASIISFTEGRFASSSNRIKKTLVNNEVFRRISYTNVITEMPLIGIKEKRAILNRFNKLCDVGVLKKYIQGNKTFFAPGEKRDTLFYSKEDVSKDVPNNNSMNLNTPLEVSGMNLNTPNPIINNNPIINSSSNEDQAKPAYGKQEINLLLDAIKNACSRNGLIYSGKGQDERNAAGWLLSKSFSERISEFGMGIETFVNNIILVSTKLKYNTKQVTSAKLIYYNREEIVNKAKQQNIETKKKQEQIVGPPKPITKEEIKARFY